MKKMMSYQEEAVNQLLTLSNMYFKIPGNETIVLQAPTGSGKTFMMTNYINMVVNNSDLDLCFLWVSIGTGDLHIQSYKSVKRDADESITCTLLENEFSGGKDKISQNEVVFVNWEKIRAKNKKTGEYKNLLMKDIEKNNFKEVLENTRSINRKIVLIIDESHVGATTARAKEIRDEIIVPELTIEMSATPVLDDRTVKVPVDPTRVIDEEMIKKEVLINPGISEIADDEMDSEELILESAYRKREELATLYNEAYETKEAVEKINPLVLIQLPNSTAGEAKKESVIKFLNSKGVSVDNGKLAIWLNDDTINSEAETLLPLNSKVEYLIFKMAIDTGWDCPRAQILVKFRETKSITFEIQTVGRILRMPEAKHYLNDKLNSSYVYTNIKSIAIKKEIYNPNIIKSCLAKRKALYTSTPLRSYYRNRTDFGDITSSFYVVFEHIFCQTFGIEQVDNNTITNAYDNMEKLKIKGVTTDYGKTDSIIKDVSVKSETIDKDIKIDEKDNLFGVYASTTDLEIKYDNLINSILNGFAPKRSIPTVKQAILFTFKKYLGLESARGGIMYIQNLIVSNEEIFSPILNSATNAYKPVHEMEVNSKSSERFNDEWEIDPDKNYNPETTRVLPSKLSLYQPLYMELKNDKIDELESKFISYLDNHESKIEWFWKNGSEHMEKNFGIQKEDKSTFQPDFIIKFKDGSIGIFDTKGGQYPDDDRMKSDALYRYISEERYKGKNLFGGLVVLDNEIFKYYDQPSFKPYKDAKEEWKNFNNLFL